MFVFVSLSYHLKLSYAGTNTNLEIALNMQKNTHHLMLSLYRRLVSSVGRAPVYWAGSRGFKPRPDQHSGSLNNWEESAAFVTTSANG